MPKGNPNRPAGTRKPKPRQGGARIETRHGVYFAYQCPKCSPLKGVQVYKPDRLKRAEVAVAPDAKVSVCPRCGFRVNHRGDG